MTTCSRCKSIVEDGGRLCTKHREQKRTQQMRARNSRSLGVCYRCGSRDSLPMTRHCARCYAYFRERSLPHLEHDLEAHTKIVLLTRQPASLCLISGRSLLALRKVGCSLTVDRLNSQLGYVEGNMQLLASDLNSAKGAGWHVPQSAIHRLISRLDQTKNDRLSLVPGATRRD